MPTSQTNEALKFLPAAGQDRWWRVELNPKSRAKPLVIHLMECFSPGRRAMSKPIGMEYCTANERDIKDTADTILARVADYKKFVGEYGLDEKAG